MKIETLIELLGVMAKAHPCCEVAVYQYFTDGNFFASGVDTEKEGEKTLVVIR